MTPAVPVVQRLCRSAAALAAGLVLAACLAWPAAGQPAGVSYTLTPMAERVRFDEDAGLADATFLGGRLGFGFGAYAELSGVYLASRHLTTDFAAYDELGEVLQERFGRLPARDVAARRYGAELKFNLGRGAVFPTVALGTGLLQLNPENLDASRTIYLSGAAGLQLSFADHYTLVVLAEDLVYRSNPARTLLSDADLGDLGLRATDFAQAAVHNYALTVGLQLYLGGRAHGELSEVDRALRAQLRGGLGGIRLLVEPAAGLFDFDEALGFQERHPMAGAQAGFDLGPYFGLRGFYWRAMEDDAVTTPAALQAYGGEVKLNFGALTGRLVPHLVVGGGYLDVLDGYRGPGGAAPADRPFATGGVGLTLPLGRAVQLHGGVRVLLLSNDDVADVSDPSQVVASYLYTAGISFGLGGGRAAPLPGTTAPSGLEAELLRARAQVDSLQRALAARRPGAPPAALGPQVEAAAVPPAGDDTRWITVPLPDRGAIYVRYGETTDALPGQPEVVYVDPATGRVVQGASPAAAARAAAGRPLTAAEIEAIVRQVVQEQAAAPSTPPAEAAARTELLAARVAELERRLAEAEEAPPQAVPQGAEAAPVAAGEAGGGFTFAGLMPVAGTALSGAQVAFAGLRADVRSNALVGARFLPEVVAAAGADGLSFGFNLDAAFPLGLDVGGLRPYVGLGMGFIRVDGQELVLNLLGGVEQAAGGGRFFVEYMSQDFFALNRIAAGYRLKL